jgi:hypothetical protein
MIKAVYLDVFDALGLILIDFDWKLKYQCTVYSEYGTDCLSNYVRFGGKNVPV